jgi:Arc/MetJ family transcription regulator
MKTTIEIADSLLAEAKRIAAKRHTTVRAVVEDGIRRISEEDQRERTPFRLRDGSVGGRGLRPEMRDAGHEDWLAAVYGDRA